MQTAIQLLSTHVKKLVGVVVSCNPRTQEVETEQPRGKLARWTSKTGKVQVQGGKWPQENDILLSLPQAHTCVPAHRHSDMSTQTPILHIHMEIVAQQVDVLAVKPDNLNTIPGTYSQLLQLVPWLPHAHNTHALFLINKEMLKNKKMKKITIRIFWVRYLWKRKEFSV